MPARSKKAIAAERRIKLALCLCAQGPLAFARLQMEVPEYAAGDAGAAGGAAAGAVDGAGKLKAAANKAEQSVRRLFERDKEALAERGIFVDTLETGGYALRRGTDAGAAVAEDSLEVLEAGSPQARMLRAGCSALLQDAAFSQGTALRCAMAKLSRELEVPDAIAWADSSALDALRGSGGTTRALQRKVEQALEKRKVLSFEYAGPRGIGERHVEPMGLFSSEGRSYLAAWDRDKQAERCFRLDRMSKASVAKSGRGAPDFEPRVFDAAAWYLLPFQMGGDGSASVEAAVRVLPQALWQAEKLCAGYGSVVLNGEDAAGATWYVDCCDPALLAEWCIANGPGLVPQHPYEAREAYERLLRATASGCGAAGESSPDNRSASGTDPVDGSGHAGDGSAGVISAGGGIGAADAVASARPSQSPQSLRTMRGSITVVGPFQSQRGPLRTPAADIPDDDDVIFACLALLENEGIVSIPQCARFLGVDEEAVYDALETLAFCYDVAGVHLELGERGASFARLMQPAGLPMALTGIEEEAMAAAQHAVQRNDVARTLAQTCSQDAPTCLQISYWKEGAAQPQERVVRPKALLVRDGRTYLQAWCSKAHDERLFRLDRIEAVEPLSAPGSAEIAFEAASPAQQTQEQSPVEASVTLRAGSSVPDWPGARLPKKPAADGTLRVKVAWFGSPWLPKRIASLGDVVQSVKPAQLAQRVAEYAQSLLEELVQQEQSKR